MSSISSSEILLPTYQQFDEIRSSFVRLKTVDGARTRKIPRLKTMYLFLEKTKSDLESAGFPLLTLSLSGMLRFCNTRSSKMIIRYRELPQHPDTYNSAITHDYVF